MALNYAKTNTFVLGTTISSSAVNTNFDDPVNAFGGLENMTKSLANLIVDTVLRSSGPVQAADGTVGAPGFTFTADTDSGLYRVSNNDVAIATAGVKQFEVTSAAINTFLP